VISMDETNVSFYGSKKKKWINKSMTRILGESEELNTLIATLVVASSRTEVLGYHLLKGVLDKIHFLIFLDQLVK